MTAPHHHVMKGSGGLASIEHAGPPGAHPGPDVRHTHKELPEFGPSVPTPIFEKAIGRALERATRQAASERRAPN